MQFQTLETTISACRQGDILVYSYMDSVVTVIYMSVMFLHRTIFFYVHLSTNLYFSCFNSFFKLWRLKHTLHVKRVSRKGAVIPQHKGNMHKCTEFWGCSQKMGGGEILFFLGTLGVKIPHKGLEKHWAILWLLCYKPPTIFDRYKLKSTQ